MSFKQDGALESQLHAFDVDCVATDGDAVPPLSHGTVRGTPGLFEAELFLLHFRGSDGRLLENGAQACAGFHGVSKALVLGIIATHTAQVVVLPLGGVDVGVNPLV